MTKLSANKLVPKCFPKFNYSPNPDIHMTFLPLILIVNCLIHNSGPWVQGTQLKCTFHPS